LISIIIQSTFHICCRKTLTRKSPHYYLALGKMRNIYIAYIIAYNIITDIFAIRFDCIWINIIRPYNFVSGHDNTKIKSASAAKQRQNLHIVPLFYSYLSQLLMNS